MPFAIELKIFELTAVRVNGDPVVGATVRILNAVGDEVTSNLLLATPPLTDGSGQLIKFFASTGGLPIGQAYTIQVSSPGFTTWSYTTATTFFGAGLFSATLIRSLTGAYTLTTPEGSYFSNLYPIDTQVESGDTALDWELIRFIATHSDNRTSVVEAPVVDGIAEADLHSRIRLRPRPHLVADGSVAVADPDFSDQLTVTLESVNPEGIQSVPGGFLFSAANMVPRSDSNDLSEYATGGSDRLVKWITLLTNPVVFRGFYLDVMIWLVDMEGAYVLHTEYFDGAGNQVGSIKTASLQANLQVQRIRLNATPDPIVRSANLWVTDGSDVISETLTVLYRG